MDKEKKRYCRSAREFSIDELKKKIGPLEGKYEGRIFELIKESWRNGSQSALLSPIRVAAMANLLESGEDLDYWSSARYWIVSSSLQISDSKDDYKLEGINEDRVYDVLCSYDQPRTKAEEDSLSESISLCRRIITASLDLGFIREDLRRIDGSVMSLCKALFDDYDLPIHELSYDDDWYETCSTNWTSKVEAVMSFLSESLPPMQFSIYKYHITHLGVLLRLLRGLRYKPDVDYHDYFDVVSKGQKMSANDYLPYSEFEASLLYAAQRNVEWLQTEIMQILFS